MANIKRQFKVLSLRFKKWLYISLNSEVDKDYISIQKKAESIISKALDSKESIIYQYSEIIYIQYNDYTIKFDNRNSLITNNKYTYYITLPSNITNKLFKKYKNNILNKIHNIDQKNISEMNKNLNEIIKHIN
jgi:hypothetical protein